VNCWTQRSHLTFRYNFGENRIEATISNSPSITVFLSVAAGTCLASHCLAMDVSAALLWLFTSGAQASCHNILKLFSIYAYLSGVVNSLKLFQLKFCIHLLSLPCVCVQPIFWLIFITVILYGDEYKLWNSSLCSFLHLPVNFYALIPNVNLRILKHFHCSRCVFSLDEKPSFTPVQSNMSTS
jgi:hypothetical protein